MQMGKVAFSVFALLLFLVISVDASEPRVSPLAELAENAESTQAPADQVEVQSPQATYAGTLRLYVTERFSRYLNERGIAFNNGFLDFGTVEDFTLADGSTWETNVSWSAAPFNGVFPSRMRAIAIVANQSTFIGDSDPPSGRGFTGNRVDAAALALIGAPGMNESGPGYTHTVLVEEGAATW